MKFKSIQLHIDKPAYHNYYLHDQNDRGENNYKVKEQAQRWQLHLVSQCHYQETCVPSIKLLHELFGKVNNSYTILTLYVLKWWSSYLGQSWMCLCEFKSCHLKLITNTGLTGNTKASTCRKQTEHSQEHEVETQEDNTWNFKIKQVTWDRLWHWCHTQSALACLSRHKEGDRELYPFHTHCFLVYSTWIAFSVLFDVSVFHPLGPGDWTALSIRGSVSLMILPPSQLVNCWRCLCRVSFIVSF